MTACKTLLDYKTYTSCELEEEFVQISWKMRNIIRTIPNVPDTLDGTYFSLILSSPSRPKTIAYIGKLFCSIQAKLYKQDVEYFESDDFVDFISSTVSFAKGLVTVPLCKTLITALTNDQKLEAIRLAANMLDVYLALVEKAKPKP